MPAYVCLMGTSDHLAMKQEGCFAITDDRGRGWLCYELKEGSFGDATDRAMVHQREAGEVEEKLRRLAPGQHNTLIKSVMCSPDDLGSWLARPMYGEPGFADEDDGDEAVGGWNLPAHARCCGRYRDDGGTVGETKLLAVLV